MDTEKGDEGREMAKPQNSKRIVNPKKIFVGSVLLVCMLAVMFGMGVLAARYTEGMLESDAVVPVVTMVENHAPEVHHGLVRRDEDCDEENASAADAVAAASNTVVSDFAWSEQADVSGIPNDAGVPIPISTIYSMSKPLVIIRTETKTAIVTIPEPVSSLSVSLRTYETSVELCSMDVVTKTERLTVTVVSTPSFSIPTDATVIGDPSTVTEVQTEVSYTSGLPDATVPGNPSTVTDVETDYSVSSGLPDATVPGNPETVTDFQTEISVTSGLPDATVSGDPETITDVETEFSVTHGLPDATVTGNPSTVTDIQKSFSIISSSILQPTTITITNLYGTKTRQRMSTITTYVTTSTTVTAGRSSVVVITVTDLYPPASTDFATSAADGEAVSFTSHTPTSTFTKVVTETSGSTSISTTTVVVPLPPYPSSNGTIPVYPTGTFVTVPVPTTPVVISGGTKKPEPRGWGGSNGSNNVGCTIMLIAITMLLL